MGPLLYQLERCRNVAVVLVTSARFARDPDRVPDVVEDLVHHPVQVAVVHQFVEHGFRCNTAPPGSPRPKFVTSEAVVGDTRLMAASGITNVPGRRRIRRHKGTESQATGAIRVATNPTLGR
jgi:hypothetical protein